MKISASTIYLIDVCGSLKALFITSAVVASIVALWMCFCLLEAYDEEYTLRKVKQSACAAAFFALGATLTPSSSTLVAMYVLPAIVNNDRVQSISADLMKLAEKWVDDQLGEREVRK